MNDYKVCAVVVTFNRKELLVECLDSLKNQSYPLDGIYVIDNASTDGTGELLLEKEYIEELPPANQGGTWSKCYDIKNPVDGEDIDLHYVNLSENTGGAGGFYEGVKRAYEDGYDWLWLMDDDSEPVNDALEKLSEYFDEENVSALAGVVTTANEIVSWHRGYSDFNSLSNSYIVKEVDPELLKEHKVLKIDHASFVGTLINRQSIAKIGFPRKEFFVHADDTEYSVRLRSVGEILLVRDSVIQHKDYGSSTKFIKKIFLGRTFYRIRYESFWLSYYEMRNNVYLLKKYKKSRLYWVISGLSWLAWMSTILLLDDNKWRRMRFITTAYVDGLKGNFNNEKPKKILYK